MPGTAQDQPGGDRGNAAARADRGRTAAGAAACRGGTVPLTADLAGVTRLASAGVRALDAVRGRLAAHGQRLTLITAPGSAAQAVLDLVRLDRVASALAQEQPEQGPDTCTRCVRTDFFHPERTWRVPRLPLSPGRRGT